MEQPTGGLDNESSPPDHNATAYAASSKTLAEIDILIGEKILPQDMLKLLRSATEQLKTADGIPDPDTYELEARIFTNVIGGSHPETIPEKEIRKELVYRIHEARHEQKEIEDLEADLLNEINRSQ